MKEHIYGFDAAECGGLGIVHRMSPAGDAVRGGRTGARPPPCYYSRVQVCDLQRTFSTQPFMLSELPETVAEPL